MDIGSNSVRLIIFEQQGHTYRQVLNEKSLCRLGEDLLSTQKLSDKGKKETLKTLRGFMRDLVPYGIRAGDVLAVATAAMRNSLDGAEFAEQIRDQFAFPLEIISGEEEARLSALGVERSLPNITGFMGDLGGGSLEIATLNTPKNPKAVSYPLGTLILSSHVCDETLDTYVERYIASILKDFKATDTFCIIGGSWRALIKAFNTHSTPKPPLHGFQVNVKDLSSFIDHIIDLNADQIAARYRLERPRAQLMPVAAFLLKRLLTAWQTKNVVASTAGLRDGLLYDRIIGGPSAH